MISLRRFNKTERAELAQNWNEHLLATEQDTIDKCVKATKRFNRNTKIRTFKPRYDKTSIRIIPTDTVSCLFEGLEYSENTNRKVALLNFASFKNPGGMFLKGSPAQEESLCHQSLLYPILCNFQKDYYDRHKTVLNRSLYIADILYTPDVPFIDMSVTKKKKKIMRQEFRRRNADVITCAAPNVGSFVKWNRGAADSNEVKDEIKSRVQIVLDIAENFQVDDLILGAFGCGVFKCDPTVVANAFFSHILNHQYGKFRTVYFPIPRSDKDHVNYDSFWKVWEQYFKTEK